MAGPAKSVAVLVLAGAAAAAVDAAEAQQMPPQGCNACVTAAHPPAYSGLLFRVLRGPGGPGAVAPHVHLSLPPPPDRPDTGAVEASARIVSAATASCARASPSPRRRRVLRSRRSRRGREKARS